MVLPSCIARTVTGRVTPDTGPHGEVTPVTTPRPGGIVRSGWLMREPGEVQAHRSNVRVVMTKRAAIVISLGRQVIIAATMSQSATGLSQPSRLRAARLGHNRTSQAVIRHIARSRVDHERLSGDRDGRGRPDRTVTSIDSHGSREILHDYPDNTAWIHHRAGCKGRVLPMYCSIGRPSHNDHRTWVVEA